MNHDLAALSHVEVERLLAAKGCPVVAIIPIGAVEAHGPHLPLTTDVIISEAFSRRAAELIAEDGRARALLLPALAYTPAGYAANFPGTIGIRATTLAALLEDICENLTGQGFACAAIANSHFDPANVAALRDAAARLSQRGFAVVFPDMTRRAHAGRLTAEFQSGDCHGGRFETSIVLAARPELVRRDEMARLDANPAGLLDALRDNPKMGRFEDIGMPLAYCGSPGEANVAEGRHSIDIMGGILSEAVLAALFSPSR